MDTSSFKVGQKVKFVLDAPGLNLLAGTVASITDIIANGANGIVRIRSGNIIGAIADDGFIEAAD
jgi:hypothetical protein